MGCVFDLLHACISLVCVVVSQPSDIDGWRLRDSRAPKHPLVVAGRARTPAFRAAPRNMGSFPTCGSASPRRRHGAAHTRPLPTPPPNPRRRQQQCCSFALKWVATRLRFSRIFSAVGAVRCYKFLPCFWIVSHASASRAAPRDKFRPGNRSVVFCSAPPPRSGFQYAPCNFTGGAGHP